MSQTYASATFLPLPHPLELPPSRTPAPSQEKLPTLNVDIQDGREEQRYSLLLGEQYSQRDDVVEVIWEREQQRLKEREAAQNKFATLFEPPTPRASPILSPSPLPQSTTTSLPLFTHPRPTPLKRHPWRISRPDSVSSNSSSDFGSFVTTTEDPLSFSLTHETSIESGSVGGDTTPLATEAASYNLDRASLKRQPLSSPPCSNTTLTFFDAFTHRAKQRSSAARCQVLDELLLHEDDPMWFVLEGGDKNITNDDPHDPITDPQDENLKELDETQRQPSSDSILLDIDHDYFRPSSVPTSHVSLRPLSPMRHRMPSRSTSIPPLMVAPPVACQLSASPTTSPTTSDLEDLYSSNQAQASGLERSSSFSSKLMSSLLRGAQASPPPSATASKLSDAQSTSETTLGHTDDRTTTDRPVLTDEDAKPSRPLMVSTSTMSPVSEWHATQFSVSRQRIPFAPAVVTHSMSPFAATIYRPPSGAPGFEGDRYDWDKGFSDELESERKSLTSVDVQDESSSEGNGSVTDNVMGSTSSVAIPGSRGWGTSFRFGFGPKRGKSAFKAASFLSMTQGNGLNGREGKDSKMILPLGQEIEPDTADLRDHDGGFNRHERDYSSTSSIGSGMGDLIERKVGTIELAGRRASSDSVLVPELASMLRTHLPALSRLSRSWTLIYSLDQHGISLNTLYSRCEAHLSQKSAPGDLGISKGMLLAIKDSPAEGGRRAIFGAWIAEGLKLNKGKGYSGGGESFLWKYVDGVLKVFKTTGKNNYVSLCEPDYLSFGGGDGHYGLYLDDTLFEGSSASCPTFDNEPLCTGNVVGIVRTVKFECLGLEVWGMS